MVLVKKWPFFQLFFFGNRGQKNVFYNIVKQNNAFLGYKNKKFIKSKNWHFSKWVIPWFWSKNGHFSNFFFLGSLGQENVFYNILEQKNAFLVLVKKWPFFFNFFFLVIEARKMSYNIVEQKNAFLVLVKKWLFFFNFFFLVIEARKMSFTIL